MTSTGWSKFYKGLALGALLSTSLSAAATDLQFFKTVFDTDWTTAGVGGMRNGPGTATINLSGVGSGTVTEAYLYWHGPTNIGNQDPVAAEPAIQNVKFQDQDIAGDFLGISDNNCWGFANSVAYRADVTTLVTGDGNYNLAEFSKPNANINGASLIVFFDDGNGTNNRDVVMYDGNDSNIDNLNDDPGWNIVLDGINYDSGTAEMVMTVADGQVFPDDALVVNSSTIASAGNIFQGDGVQDAGSMFPVNGLLWDIETFDVTGLLSPGLNSLELTTGVNSDCLACVNIAISLPAGTAPDQPDLPGPSVPEPASLVLLSLGLVGMSLGVRRRRFGESRQG